MSKRRLKTQILENDVALALVLSAFIVGGLYIRGVLIGG